MLLGLSKEQISLEKDIYPHTLLKRREHSLSSFTFTLMGKWACVFSKHCWRPTHSGKQTQYELCRSLTWFCWEVYETGCYPEPLQHAFVYSTRIYWVPTNGPDTVLGVGDTIVNKMNPEEEVPTHMEPTYLSPIMHSHMVTKSTTFQLAWSVFSHSFLSSAVLQCGIFIALEYIGPVNK